MVASALRAIAVEGLDFGALLRRYRVRAGLSQNQLARRAGCDPAYVNRLERYTANTVACPSRKIVLALWDALDGTQADRERLLVSAGYCPEVIVQAGGWDRYLGRMRAAVADALEGLDLALEHDI